MAMTTTQKIIAIAVTIIIISTVALPVINDMTDDEKVTFKNDSYYYADLVKDTNTHTITLASGVWTIDGVVLESKGIDFPALVTDKGVIASGGTVANIMLAGNTWAYTSVSALTATVDPSTKTVSITDVTAGTTVDDFDFTYSNVCFLAGNSGQYASVATTALPQEVYVSGLDDVLVLGCSSSNDWALRFGDTSYSYKGETSIEIHADLTAVSGYDDVYTFSLTNNVSTSDAYLVLDGDTNLRANFVFVPATVTAIVENDSQYTNLISVIPILLILVPLMMAVRMIALRRN